jgi:ABC-type sugar transport system, permease component
MQVLKKTLLYIFLFGLVIVFIFPLLYSLYYSLLPPEYMEKIVSPKYFTLSNYQTLFDQYPIFQWIMNTTVNTVLVVLGNIIICSMAGYALSRLEFPGRNLIFTFVLASMMIPYQFVITPVYIQIAKMHWIDTMLAITVPYLTNSLYIFMSKQFFATIPKEMEEAARIDGVSRAGIFFKIDFPLCKSLVVAIAIFSFTGTWNSYLIPATFLTTNTNFTLVVGLKTVKDVMFDKMNLTLAGVILLSLPILVIFWILQKHFVEGIATSGLKG